ncbi:hypothetical protein B5S28_g2169 [[Candida] boidinii]|nr:hypothetical protein B5S28_g2169 [[Candida] boidinii]OWB63044.1 hypothetical protein B5S29_g3998 [[Candida] boidinii]OWB73880.1 hypothetical protein B5S31_g3647 [[Candida] boidinii]OWB79804.1 hypothetical protein B5S32_g4041 [[Candida] boidinii]
MSTTFTDHPLEIVDISEINQDAADKLLHAAASQGFLLLEGHGFSADHVKTMFDLSQKYFETPLEEKIKYPIDESNAGYTGIGVENLHEDDPNRKVGDPKEGYNFCKLDLESGTPNHELPEYLKENSDLIKETIVHYTEVIDHVLTLLAMGLKIEEEKGGSKYFVDRHPKTSSSGSTFRFLHYPSPVSLNPQELIRAGAHTDYGGITLLFQKEGEGGLEIFSPVSKKWEPIPFVGASPKLAAKGEAPPLVVNIGDLLSYWTNGLLKSTIHRVKFPADVQKTGRSRYSIVFFSHPADETELAPVPSDLIPSDNSRGAGAYFAKHGKSQTAREHLAKRLASSYGWGY